MIITEKHPFVQYGANKTMEFDIILRSLRQVQDFVALAMVQPFEVIVGNDNQTINGKDLMGMFSLDYSHPVRVRVSCTQEQFSCFRTAAATFLA